MEHRHLDIESDEWSVAVVHSIWERGLEADISALRAAGYDQPFASVEEGVAAYLDWLNQD